MSGDYNHGWLWAYHKLRKHYCTRVTSVYGATLFFLYGNTGCLFSRRKWQKIRLKRK